MHAALHVDAPVGLMDETCVERVAQQAFDVTSADEARLAARKKRLILQPFLHVNLTLKPPACVALQRLLHDERHILFDAKDLASIAFGFEKIPGRHMEAPKSVERTSEHPTLRCFDDFPARVSTKIHQQPLDKNFIGGIADLDRGGFQKVSRREDRVTQWPIDIFIATKAAQIVNDDDDPAMAFEKCEESIQFTAIACAACDIIVECSKDTQTAPLCIPTADALL